MDNLIKDHQLRGEKSWLTSIYKEKLEEWKEFTQGSIIERYIETFDITEITENFNKHQKTCHSKETIVDADKLYFDDCGTDFLRWVTMNHCFLNSLNHI